MNTVESLTLRNAEFAEQRFAAGLKMMPSLKAIIIGCVDPRVDPAQILGIELGEVAVIRNIGGRVTATTLQELALLRKLTQARGSDLDQGWNLIVLHHNDCGITCLAHSPELLAKYFGVAPADLDALAIADPHKAVAVDVAALKANPLLPGGFLVTGLVYDVTTGRIEIVVPTSLLRPENPS